ncbi:MAG: hypothetical protein ABEL76_14500 [Bradymonadaceae bacterium]
MPSLDEIDGPTEEEQRKTEAVLDAIDEADRLTVLPFFERETGERVLFLVAVDEGEDSAEVRPIGPVFDFDEIMETFDAPDELAE